MTDPTPTIMLVDDEQVVTQTLRSIIELETDYHVLAFNAPADALEALREAHADLVISDFLMPEMNGIDFLCEMKRRQPDAVRVLLTGYADRDSAVRGINDVGLFQFIEKPWDNDQLILTIRNGLNKKRITRRLQEKIEALDKTLRERDRIAEQHDRLREELVLARRVQEGMLPQSFPELNGFSFHARYLPALEVGGDFYDVIPLTDNRAAMIVADVTGHGVQAALTTTLLKSAFNEFVRQDVGPLDILTRMNEVLYRVLPTDIFATASVATINASANELTLANGGAPHPFHLRREGRDVETVISEGLLLGVLEPDIYNPTDSVTVEIQAGDRVLFLTDGLVEVENDSGDEFGATRLCPLLKELHGHTSEGISQSLLARAREFSADHHDWDDVTLLTLERFAG